MTDRHPPRRRGLALALVLALSAPTASAQHDDHDDHEEHAHEDEAEAIRIAAGERAEFGIELAVAGPARLGETVALPGEIVVDADRLAHVLPRVRGIVREVHARLGDRVESGQVLAVLDSRELAEAKASYLASREHLELARSSFERERRLFERKVAAERDFLQARQSLAEAEIQARNAEQQLHAIGLGHAELERLASAEDTAFTRFEVRAPFSGQIIQKHITLGELVTDADEAFVVADLDEVWVHLSVHPRDLPRVHVGESVRVTTREGLQGDGRLTYVAPLLSAATRTALARATLRNEDRRWRPGLFVTGSVATGDTQVDVAVPRSALVELDGGPAIFVETSEGFEPRAVTLGVGDDERVEIRSGLAAGERYVARNAFVIRAEMQKDALAHAGHAH